MKQLEAAAPGWIEPKYGDAIIEIVNPFTRVVSHRQRELLTEAPLACPPDEIYTLIKVGRAYHWSVTCADLEPLMKLLTNASDPSELHRQALQGPTDVEHVVLVIPDAFVDALAAVKPSQIDALAESWQSLLRWDATPKALLEELVEVAREARAAAGHRMFAYVSL